MKRSTTQPATAAMASPQLTITSQPTRAARGTDQVVAFAVGNVSTSPGPSADPAIATLRMITGTGGPVGITIDGRSAPLGEWAAYRFGWAPRGLATRRQLAACGLRPGGAQPVAQLSWRHGRTQRIAYLYDVAAAKPKRPMTPAKADALLKAMRARRTCPLCHLEALYVIPRSLGACLDCAEQRTRTNDLLSNSSTPITATQAGLSAGNSERTTSR